MQTDNKQSYFQPHKADCQEPPEWYAFNRKWGKETLPEKAELDAQHVYAGSRRCKCYCLPRHTRKAPIPHIALNEKELVLASVCATGEPCSQLAAVTALCLESPKPAFRLHHHLPPQRERMELRCFAQAVV